LYFPTEETSNRPEVKTLEDFQFRYRHILASAMLDGDVNFAHLNSDIPSNPRHKEARSKVEVLPQSGWSNQIMASPAILTVKIEYGKVFSGERRYPIFLTTRLAF